jgi:uncharacterized protein (TIGR02246 family)
MNELKPTIHSRLVFTNAVGSIGTDVTTFHNRVTTAYRAIVMMFLIHLRTGDQSLNSNPETEINDLFSRWVSAVQAEDLAGIRANHASDVLMYDVPLPFFSRGLDAYMETWKIFFPCQAKPIEFRFEETQITAGKDVAFLTAIGHCGHMELGEKTDLKFRLTMGLRKNGDEWLIVHEHHSVPAQE